MLCVSGSLTLYSTLNQDVSETYCCLKEYYWNKSFMKQFLSFSTKCCLQRFLFCFLPDICLIFTLYLALNVRTVFLFVYWACHDLGLYLDIASCHCLRNLLNHEICYLVLVDYEARHCWFSIRCINLQKEIWKFQPPLWSLLWTYVYEKRVGGGMVTSIIFFNWNIQLTL